MKYKSLDHLLPDAKSGDKEGLKLLWIELEKYLKGLYIRDYYFQGYGKEDIIQDTILLVVEKIESIERGLKSYTYRVWKNLVGDQLRKTYGRKNLDELRKKVSDDIIDIESEDFNLKPIVTGIDPDMEIYYEDRDVNREIDLQNILRKFNKLQKICREYVRNKMDGTKRKLFEIFQDMFPGKTRNAFHVQVFRCREIMIEIIKREDLI
jgi:DNA-directed RNA polymerase specialized sigma24 family protein